MAYMITVSLLLNILELKLSMIISRLRSILSETFLACSSNIFAYHLNSMVLALVVCIYLIVPSVNNYTVFSALGLWPS